MNRTLASAIVGAAALVAAQADAAIIWTDWTGITAPQATGTLASATVTVNGPFDTSQVAGGTDFWRQGGVNPWPAYDGVSNLPANNDFISPAGNRVTHVFNFSQVVKNPYIAIISLGQPGIQTSWTFSDPFTLVDQGQGFWGNGVFSISGNTLTAGEAHGIIRFTGSFTQLTLVTDNTENWSGLTLGVESVGGAVVPEPAVWAMLITGFGLVGAAARRRRAAIGGVTR